MVKLKINDLTFSTVSPNFQFEVDVSGTQAFKTTAQEILNYIQANTPLHQLSNVDDDGIQGDILYRGSSTWIAGVPPELKYTQGLVVSYNKQTISNTLSLTESSSVHQFIDGGNSDRDIELPSSPTNGRIFVIKNTGPSNALFVKFNSSTIYTLDINKAAAFIYTGSSWDTI